MRIAVITGASAGIGREFVYAVDKELDFDEIWVIARREERLLEVVFGPFAEKDLDQLLMSARLNALALTAMCHVSLPYMKAGSAIVNMGSNSAWQPVPWQAVYGASKSYVLNLSRAIGRELKPKGIHVMCVCPGWIKTEFQSVAEHDKYIRYVDRWYGPDEVAVQAMKDLKKKKTVSILGEPVRRQVRLVKFLPVRYVMDTWCRQQGF